MSPLVAAINTLSVSDLNEGTKTLVQGLLPALGRVAPEIRQLLVCSHANRHLFEHDVDSVEVELEHAHVLRRVWLDQRVPRLVRGRADVLVSSAGVGSLVTSLPTVTIVSHHFALPSCRAAEGEDGPSGLRRLYYGPLFRAVLRRSAVVLGISQYLADGLVDELGVERSKVMAMPLGVYPPDPVPALDGRDPLVLFVGTLYPYKDAPVALDAFARARASLPAGARLVFAGKDPDGAQIPELRARAEAAGVDDAVDLLGSVSEAALEDLYRRASVLVLPSRYEGFGLPVAEAMSRGTPVVVADTTSLPEVAGDGGLVVPQRDAGALAAALVRVLTEPGLRLTLAERALRRGSAMTWDASAEILRDAIVRAAASR